MVKPKSGSFCLSFWMPEIKKRWQWMPSALSGSQPSPRPEGLTHLAMLSSVLCTLGQLWMQQLYDLEDTLEFCFSKGQKSFCFLEISEQNEATKEQNEEKKSQIPYSIWDGSEIPDDFQSPRRVYHNVVRGHRVWSLLPALLPRSGEDSEGRKQKCHTHDGQSGHLQLLIFLAPAPQ